MAVDKLVDSAQLDADLTSVANAIRTKGGTSGQLAFPAGFVSAVEAIETGGGGGEIDPLVDNTIQSYESSAVTSIGNYKFQSCTHLTSVVCPDVTSIGANSFDGCTVLATVSMKKLSSIRSGGQYAFRNCIALENIAFPLLNEVTANTFNGCSALERVDVKGAYVRASAFANCTNLTVLILRNSATSSLANINAFSGTPFASGGAGGTLYVPQSLISSYQSATNWSTILGYANNSIQAIEGSEYENSYADGTPIT